MKISAVKRLFVGSPLATAQARHERLSKTSAYSIPVGLALAVLIAAAALLFRKGVVVVDAPVHLR